MKTLNTFLEQPQAVFGATERQQGNQTFVRLGKSLYRKGGVGVIYGVAMRRELRAGFVDGRRQEPPSLASKCARLTNKCWRIFR